MLFADFQVFLKTEHPLAQQVQHFSDVSRRKHTDNFVDFDSYFLDLVLASNFSSFDLSSVRHSVKSRGGLFPIFHRLSACTAAASADNTVSMDREENLQNALLTFDSVFLALGLASNLFVCFIMTRRKLTRKSISNFYIFHLSVAEVVYRMALAVLKIFVSERSYRFISNAECQAMTFWPNAMCAAVFVLLAGIAMDRKDHIINPLKILAMDTHQKTRIVLIWLFSVAISTPTLFSARVNPRLNSDTRDNTSVSTTVFICVLPRGSLLSQISFTIYFLFAFIVPLTIIAHSYCKIFIYLRERAKTRKLSESYIRSKYKALRMLILIIVSFLLSWGPVMFCNLATVYGAIVRVGNISVKQISISISLTSSVIHPVLYSFGNANFRSEVVRTFRSCAKCVCNTT